MHPPTTGEDWVGLTADRLPTDQALAWAVRADCGAVVLFAGTVRDHAEGRDGVTELEYEAYDEQVEPRLAAVAAEARARWSGLGRIALLHRVGPLAVTDTSVVVVVSAAHRGEAFDAGRFCIDTLKASAPIWKKEHWGASESDWVSTAQPIAEVGSQ